MSPRTKICTKTEALPEAVEGLSYREGDKTRTVAAAINSPPKVDQRIMASGDIFVEFHHSRCLE